MDPLSQMKSNKYAGKIILENKQGGKKLDQIHQPSSWSKGQQDGKLIPNKRASLFRKDSPCQSLTLPSWLTHVSGDGHTAVGRMAWWRARLAHSHHHTWCLQMLQRWSRWSSCTVRLSAFTPDLASFILESEKGWATPEQPEVKQLTIT